MGKCRVMFTFPSELVPQPLIYNLGHRFEIATNIRRADVTEDRGWVVLELEGEVQEIEKGLAWVSEQGVRVDPIEGDIVEG